MEVESNTRPPRKVSHSMLRDRLECCIKRVFSGQAKGKGKAKAMSPEDEEDPDLYEDDDDYQVPNVGYGHGLLIFSPFQTLSEK